MHHSLSGSERLVYDFDPATELGGSCGEAAYELSFHVSESHLSVVHDAGQDGRFRLGYRCSPIHRHHSRKSFAPHYSATSRSVPARWSVHTPRERTVVNRPCG